MSNRAWVTLATNDSYGLGALVLAHSLRRAGSAYPAVVLITPAVTEPMRERLRAVFAEVIVVDVLDSGDAAHLALLRRPELGITFTKIHCWSLTQYEKCVFLDADTLVVQNSDDLFERDELSAAPDVGWPDCFNSGVFVYKPSQETFDALIRFAQERGSFDGGDQGLLNSFFSDWAHGDISKHLPFLYNVTSAAFYSYLPALKHYGQDLKIIHFIGAAKPWLQSFNWDSRTVDAPAHLQGLLQLWWEIFVASVHQQLDISMVEMEALPASLHEPVYYQPQVDPDSEFPWHREDAQKNQEEENQANKVDMTLFFDPWDRYVGNIPPINEEKTPQQEQGKLEITQEVRDHVWSYHAQMQDVINTLPTWQTQSEHFHHVDHSYQDNHQWQHHDTFQGDHHHDHQHYLETHHDNQHHHVHEHHNDQKQHYDHQYHVEQIPNFEQHSHHNKLHVEHHDNKHYHHHQDQQNNDMHGNHKEYHHKWAEDNQVTQHNHVHKPKELHAQYDYQHKDEQGKHIRAESENKRRKRPNHARLRRLHRIDVGFTNGKGLVNGELSSEASDLDEDIPPRHPYDGFYLRHRATIDSKGQKICTHEVPPTPPPSPPPASPPPTINSTSYEFNGTFTQDEQSGVAGNLARVAIDSGHREAIDELTRRQGWEAGNIDYMGADSFDNIWAKISQTLNQTPKQPSPPPSDSTPPPKIPSPSRELPPVDQPSQAAESQPIEVKQDATPAAVEVPKEAEPISIQENEALASQPEPPQRTEQKVPPTPPATPQTTPDPASTPVSETAPEIVAKEAPKAQATPIKIITEAAPTKPAAASVDTPANTEAAPTKPAEETAEAAANKETAPVQAAPEVPVEIKPATPVAPVQSSSTPVTSVPLEPAPASPAVADTALASPAVADTALASPAKPAETSVQPIPATPSEVPLDDSSLSLKTISTPDTTLELTATDSPPLANTPAKEEGPPTAVAKLEGESRRKGGVRLQLSVPRVADPLPTPDSEQEDAASLAQSIIAGELATLATPTITAPTPPAPVSPPAPQLDKRLSVEEPNVETPPPVSLAQIGVKPKAKPSTAAQIESSIKSPDAEPSAPTEVPKKKVVKKVVKKDGAAAAAGDAPVPPPRKKEKKPKEK